MSSPIGTSSAPIPCPAGAGLISMHLDRSGRLELPARLPVTPAPVPTLPTERGARVLLGPEPTHFRESAPRSAASDEQTLSELHALAEQLARALFSARRNLRSPLAQRPRDVPASTAGVLEIERLRALRADVRPLVSGRPELREPVERTWSALVARRADFIERKQTLVAHVVRGFRRSALPTEELMQEGTLGLMRAIEKYDPAQRTRFSTYAVFWIRATIIRALQNQARVVRVPTHTLEQIRRLDSLEREAASEPGAPPTTAVARALGVSESRLAEIAACREMPISLDERATLSDPPRRPLCLEAKGPSPFAVLAERERRTLAGRLLDALSEREQQIVRLRWGLESDDPLSFPEIASGLGISAERVRQIEKAALRKMREACDARRDRASEDLSAAV